MDNYLMYLFYVYIDVTRTLHYFNVVTAIVSNHVAII